MLISAFEEQTHAVGNAAGQRSKAGYKRKRFDAHIKCKPGMKEPRENEINQYILCKQVKPCICRVLMALSGFNRICHILTN